MRLLIATTNPDKLREIVPMLSECGVQVVTLRQLPAVAAPEETGATFAENARLKALAYAAHTDLITVAEDSGLEVSALDHAPGIHSARFLGGDVTYAARRRRISSNLAAPVQRPREARFVAAVAVAHGDCLLFETEACLDGEIALVPAGANGFGYDPIFWYPPFGKTTAECSTEEKVAISHRARAFRDLARWLRERGPVQGPAPDVLPPQSTIR